MSSMRPSSRALDPARSTPDPKRPGRLLTLAALLTVCVTATQAAESAKVWETTGFNRPESVIVNPATNTLLVSSNSAGTGFISEVGLDGTILHLHLVDGLVGARGMALVGSHLFVAEREELAEIDLATDTIIQRYPAKGAVFLNDLVATSDGRVFATDTSDAAIWLLQDGAFTLWLKSAQLIGANGLALDGDRLLVGLTAGMPAPPAAIRTVDLATKSIGNLGSGAPVAAADGMERLSDGGLLVTDNAACTLIHIAPDGSRAVVATLAGGTAGLAVIPANGEVVVAEMPQNALAAVALPAR